MAVVDGERGLGPGKLGGEGGRWGAFCRLDRSIDRVNTAVNRPSNGTWLMGNSFRGTDASPHSILHQIPLFFIVLSKWIQIN